MMQTEMSYEAEMRNLVEALERADADEAMAMIGAEAWNGLNRAEVATSAPEATNAEEVNAWMGPRGTEACSRIVLYKKLERLDAPEVEELVSGVGGGLDYAVDRFRAHDVPGAVEGLEASWKSLSLNSRPE